jgi:hypothetical protein
MNFQSEETFFNFDMFNEDNSEDLNFLFSETPEIPEIPAPSNDATDPMASTSQVPTNHFDFDMKSNAVLKSTNMAKLPNSSLGEYSQDRILRARHGSGYPPGPSCGSGSGSYPTRQALPTPIPGFSKYPYFGPTLIRDPYTHVINIYSLINFFNISSLLIYTPLIIAFI